MPPLALPTLSPAEVASHCSKKSCYVLVDCNVYDVTEFLQDHPGGDGLIIPYGGKDVGAIMRDELSHLHSESAYAILNDYLIGSVAGKPVTGALTAHDKPVDIVPLLPNQDSIVLTAYRADFDADYRKHKFLDLRKPLLMQIWSGGFSSDFYLEQIHRPRHYTYGNSAPIFGNFLEPLTVTKWWIVPIIWLPPVICSFYYAIERLTPTKTAAFCVIGLGLWTLFEYGWHRWICHVE